MRCRGERKEDVRRDISQYFTFVVIILNLMYFKILFKSKNVFEAATSHWLRAIEGF